MHIMLFWKFVYINENEEQSPGFIKRILIKKYQQQEDFHE